MTSSRIAPIAEKTASLLDIIAQYENKHGATSDSSNAFERHRTLARRLTTGVIVCSNLTIDFGRQRAMQNGEPVELTMTEFKLLELLAPYAGKPLPREFSMTEVWGPSYEGDIEDLRQSMWSLQGKLKGNLPLRRSLWSLRRVMTHGLGL